MSNYTVSSDVDTLLKKSSKDDIKTYLDVPNIENLTTIIQSNSANWINSRTTISNVSGYSYTLALSDAYIYLRKYHSTAHILVIPYDGSAQFLSGMSFTIRNSGLSAMTLSAATNVTLNYDTTYDSNIIDPKNSSQLIYLGSNTWDIV